MCLLGILLALTCAATPNFLVLITDDQRPDALGALGNPDLRTPNLDRLSREGMIFRRAYCSFPLCVPSRAEILTGASAFRNGVPFSANRRLASDQAFWAETLTRAGYRTVYSGKWMNDGSPSTRGYQETVGLFSSGGAGASGKEPRYGRKGRLITGYRGWTFKDPEGHAETSKGIGLTPDTSRHIADAVVDWLDTTAQEKSPFFLHVNFTAPHDPLLPTEALAEAYDPSLLKLPGNLLPQHPFDHGNFSGRDEKLLPWPRTEADIRDEWAAYYAVLEDMDQQVGRILKALSRAGKRDSTYVFFSSDHGLALGSHGLMGKQNMYEHSLRVPFVIQGPGVPSGSSTTAFALLRDLFPTTCELAGVPVPSSVEGLSLVPVLKDPSHQPRPFVVGYYDRSQRALVEDRWKWIVYPESGIRQLFDLRQDPEELRNLANEASLAGLKVRLDARLRQWLIEHQDPVRW